jgi:GNAT superfamily N-acetyltransferase
MNISLRKIGETDFADLIALFHEFASFEKHPEKMTNSVAQMSMEKAHIKGFVAVTESNEIIGYATCFFAYFTWIGKSMYMDDLYVKTEFRGLGIGTKLINSVIDLAKTEHCKKLRWQVCEWNHPGIDFYKSLGAEISPIESNCDLILNG